LEPETLEFKSVAHVLENQATNTPKANGLCTLNMHPTRSFVKGQEAVEEGTAKEKPCLKT
jgi:hypothetical protein